DPATPRPATSLRCHLFPYPTPFRSAWARVIQSSFLEGTRLLLGSERSRSESDIARRLRVETAGAGDVAFRARPLAPEEEARGDRSEEHTSELQSRFDLVCRLLLEKK